MRLAYTKSARNGCHTMGWDVMAAGLAALSGVAGGRARVVKYAGRAGPLHLFNRREDVSM